MDTSSRLRRSLFWMLLCGLVCGCQPTAVEELPPPRVTVAHPVQRDLVDEDEYNGWMQASQTVDVRAGCEDTSRKSTSRTATWCARASR